MSSTADTVILSNDISDIHEENYQHGECIDQANQMEHQDAMEQQEQVDVYVKPISYDWTIEPIQLTHATSEFNNGFDRKFNNFLKGCKWAPDGSCIVTNSEDKCLRLFNLPSQFYTEPPSLDGQFDEMKSVIKMKESEMIYDYCWYPKMNSADPSTCFIASTSRDNPIHLWDAYSGHLVCTYKAYNYADEIIAANCLAFSPDGGKIFCGFDKTIRIFDSISPGKSCQIRPTNEYKQGQHGIISCISVNPSNPNIYAAGSYSKSIALYEEPFGDQLCILIGQKGGVTHLMFSNDGTKLYSGARKDSEILCWDIRNLGDVLHVINRSVHTNQRIYFDLSPDFNCLATGSDNGFLSVYDLHNSNNGELNLIRPFKAHNDCVNGVSFHPTLPLIASSSGQRRFNYNKDLLSDKTSCGKSLINDKSDVLLSSDNESDLSDSELNDNLILTCENSLKLWWCCDRNCYNKSEFHKL